MDTRNFVIVEDDERFVERHVMPAVAGMKGLELHVAYSAREARECFGRLDDLFGASIDVELPDGNGFDVARDLRPRFPRAHLLFLSAHFRKELVNRAAAFGAPYLTKSECRTLPCLLEHMLATEDDPLTRVLAEFAREHRLTDKETEVLRSKLRGATQKQTGGELAIAATTVRTHARHISEKAGADLQTVAALLLGRILGSRS